MGCGTVKMTTKYKDVINCIYYRKQVYFAFKSHLIQDKLVWNCELILFGIKYGTDSQYLWTLGK